MSASMTSQRLQKLRSVLAREDAKGEHCNRVRHTTSSSRFRGCALDTHETLPSHDHRAAPTSPYKRTLPMRRKTFVDPAVYLQHALGPVECMPETDTSGLLAERSKALQSSDWALLDTLEAHMCTSERSRQAQVKQQTCQQMRSCLDMQMQEAANKQAEQRQQRERDAITVQQAVLQHAQREAQRTAASRIKQRELKTNTEQQVQAFRDKQAAQLRRKLEDEDAELRETQRLLAEERAAAEAAKHTLAKEHACVRAENEARIAAKRAAADCEKAQDRALMEETMRTLAKQEADRAQAVKEFHAAIERRGNRAGQQVVREAAELVEREERLMRAATEQKAQDDAAKVAHERAAAARAQREVDESRAAQLTLKAQACEKTKADAIQFVEEVKAKDLHARSVQKAEDDARRLAAQDIQRVLKEQMAEKLHRDVFGDVNMTQREQSFMKPIVRQAQATVKQPHPIAVNRPW